ncbi:Asator [Strongyloides ratti]|uniref:non-specific serine/threonine protein kinase n=1 Tax=Strongyloides ratti TaxID=34506 RepID=A0A090LMC0_STRRB|nr:Asator [Strongyloides ratti]CEF69323.1 Asator [Strongyloides ratti]
MSANDGPANLSIGTVIGRFKILKKIGEGSCGAVYTCSEISTKKYAALKAELISNYGNGLKLEVQVLKRLSGKKHVAQLLSCGKTDTYCYMVVSLLGVSLYTFMRSKKFDFSLSTIVRISIQMLFALKQIHQIGIVHRDLKPANMTVGRKGIEKKIIHIIDFGLSRDFTIIENDKLRLRKPREKCLFRGTIKYCSVATMEKFEQGRNDDLISLFYICADIHKILPWHYCDKTEEVLKMKKEYSDELLFEFCPIYSDLIKYAKKLKYHEAPDYGYLSGILKKEMTKNGFKFSDPYEWEEHVDEFNLKFMPNIEGNGNLPPNSSSNKIITTDTINKFFDKHFSQEAFEKDELGF